ncbi:alpha/beta hydrolase [Pedobacter punctiformis]|uniref:Alpha/beta hydrolase n=1 Tax=Pedobacter punctiformis TaxID=3004097 RepID=A0ABT4LBV2_9SPHI|nr:alpha/beta hydrolase [Pedobacter sp. HCMS5-2]MCZ4245192.1 alpha/beta hydrolase [Pedobacter sp. HCMS5-2]
MTRSFLSILFFMAATYTQAQQIIPLYPDSVPGSKYAKNYQEVSETGKDGIIRISKVSIPTLMVFEAPAALANGAAVIICPGGGYGILAYNHEGTEVAKRFNEIGITAFVLKYRLPSDEIMVDKTYALLQDAEQAIYLVRKNAKQYGVKPNKIGIMGFSAGGHLASTLLAHYNDVKIKDAEKINLRPDFGALIYPVISFEQSIHTGTMKNLLGANPPESLKKYFSADQQVNKKTPPVFFVHARDDQSVPVQNSVLMNEALKKQKVRTGLYLYANGGHGFGLHNKTSDVDWFNLLRDWLKSISII